MAITWNAQPLDTGDFSAWCEQRDYAPNRDNWEFFTSFVFRLAALRCAPVGTVTPDVAKEFMVRDAMFCAVDEYLSPIPHEFVRRMIGLETNIFPRQSDEQFAIYIGERIRENAIASFQHDWNNF